MPAQSAKLVPHGTPDYGEMRALGLRPDELTIFSSNINPFGPPPAVVDALRAALTPNTIARYPDRLSLELTDLLAAYHDLPTETILVGNGTADLLWLIGLLYMQHRRVAILNPTFGEYHNVAAIMQAEIINLCHPGWTASADSYMPGAHRLDQVAAELHQCAPEVVFVCNPNNPTGHYFAPDELLAMYDAAPQALWIIDEAYAEFMQPPATVAGWMEQGNWLVLRSMTKDFALGGLRLGYLVAAPAIAKALQTVQSPWNVNTLAQLAGCASLREGQPWRAETITRLHAETASLRAQLLELGYEPHPTTTNYFLVPVESPASLRRELLRYHLVIRDCTSFGLPHYIRIATQLPEANARLLHALREIRARRADA